MHSQQNRFASKKNRFLLKKEKNFGHTYEITITFAANKLTNGAIFGDFLGRCIRDKRGIMHFFYKLLNY